MKKLLVVLAVLTFSATVWPGVGVADDNNGNRGNLKAFLSGYQEVPPVSTTGNGSLVMKLKDPSTLEFTLSFSDLKGSLPMAIIGFGQPGVQGGTLVNICGDGVKPACVSGQEITGTITAADILDLSAQGIAAGDFESALLAIQSGNTYVNVLSDEWTKGEIRGQILTHRYGLAEAGQKARSQARSQLPHTDDQGDLD
jgi:CHRD domain